MDEQRTSSTPGTRVAARVAARAGERPPDRTDRQGNIVERVAQVYLDHADPLEETLVVTWTSFGATFGGVRLVTHSIRNRWLPFLHNVSAGGKHLHHYNFGIAALTAVGMVAVRGTETAVRHPVVGIAYGAGAALIADEAALLLNLEDVYWAKEGRTSVDVAVGILAALGLYAVAAPFWQEAAREARRGLRRL
ncbi:MAG: hypothetical protein ACRDN9_08400 [Streptosporangiaceae bacterium]